MVRDSTAIEHPLHCEIAVRPCSFDSASPAVPSDELCGNIALQTFLVGPLGFELSEIYCIYALPSTDVAGELLATTVHGESADVELAVTAARTAYTSWSQLTPHARARHLYR